MNSHFHYLAPSDSSKEGFSRSFWLALATPVLALSLVACNKNSEPVPGNTSKSSTAPGASGGVEVRTPSAPDSRGGGSSGFKGSAPTADTSGGSSTGTAPGTPGAASGPGYGAPKP